MRLFLLFILPVLLFLLSSCKKYQAADPTFFIRSGNVTVSTSGNEGTASQKISDLWLYVNGKYQGTYPVGSLMPVISNNKGVEINVFAGIKNNGISDTRIFYPFFDLFTLDTLVEAGKTIERSFNFKYRPATVFGWNENFDSNSGYSIQNVNSDTEFKKCSPGDSFEGGSIVMSLPDNNIRARIESSGDPFTLPTGTGNVYLELHYKCNTEFEIGLTNDNGSQQEAAIRIHPQENWNKIYVQLSTAVNILASNKYKVYIEFFKDPSIAETRQVFLDNIKLLYF